MVSAAAGDLHTCSTTTFSDTAAYAGRCAVFSREEANKQINEGEQPVQRVRDGRNARCEMQDVRREMEAGSWKMGDGSRDREKLSMLSDVQV